MIHADAAFTQPFEEECAVPRLRNNYGEIFGDRRRRRRTTGRATFLSIAWHLWKSRGELFPTASASARLWPLTKLTQQATSHTWNNGIQSERGREGKIIWFIGFCDEWPASLVRVLARLFKSSLVAPRRLSSVIWEVYSKIHNHEELCLRRYEINCLLC